MADLKTCDLCNDSTLAVDTVTLAGKTITAVVVDVCEKHMAEFKKLVRRFTGQDADEPAG